MAEVPGIETHGEEPWILRTGRLPDLGPMRKALVDAGFTRDFLQEKLKPLLDARGRLDYGLLRACMGREPLDTLLRLFALPRCPAPP